MLHLLTYKKGGDIINRKAVVCILLIAMSGLLYTRISNKRVVHCNDNKPKIKESNKIDIIPLEEKSKGISNAEDFDEISLIRNKRNEVAKDKLTVEDTVESNTGLSIHKTENEVYCTNDDEKLLARLIESEAGCEPYEGKLAVANVVLYRMKRDNETLKDVVYKNGQFDGIHTLNFFIEPSEDSVKASKNALSGSYVIDNAYYFADLRLCNPSFALKSKLIARIGNHWFFKE